MNTDLIVRAILDAVPSILDSFAKFASEVGVYHAEFILVLFVALLYGWIFLKLKK